MYNLDPATQWIYCPCYHCRTPQGTHIGSMKRSSSVSWKPIMFLNSRLSASAEGKRFLPYETSYEFISFYSRRFREEPTTSHRQNLKKVQTCNTLGIESTLCFKVSIHLHVLVHHYCRRKGKYTESIQIYIQQFIILHTS